MARYYHLVWFAVGYAAIAFVSICSVSVASDRSLEFMVIPIFSIAIASIVLVSMWAVFGPGRYLLRLLISHGLGLVVGLGYLLGSLVTARELPPFIDLITPTMIGLLIVPAISAGAQLPFWILRGFFGWQFVLKGAEPGPGFNIQDIFVLTFLFAAAVGGTEVAAQIQESHNNQFRHVPTERVVLEDGTYDYVERQTSKDEINQQRQRMRRSISTGFMSFALITFLLTWLALPIVLLTFRVKEPLAGCFLTILYGLSAVYILVACVGVVSGGAGVGVEFFFFSLYAIGLMVAAAGSPMLISLCVGFQLTSRNRFQKANQKEKRLGQSEKQTSV